MSFSNFGDPENLEQWSRKVRDIMEGIQKRSGFCEYRASGTWAPRVNLYASRDAYYVCAELAGLSLDLLYVECTDSCRVRLAGHRDRPAIPGYSDLSSIEAMEIDEGAFVREIELPDHVDVDAVEINYDRGYLWITLPRSRRT